MSDYRSGIVGLIGKPNVGKSTLINNLIGRKVTIVSPKPHTTQNVIRCVLTVDNAQIIFVDTPGFRKPLNRLDKYVMKITKNAVYGNDLLVFMLDAQYGLSKAEDYIVDELKRVDTPKFLAINKIDVVKDKDKLESFEVAMRNSIDFEKVHYISALKGTGLKELLEDIITYLPISPPLYPRDSVVDASAAFIIRELIREKVMWFTGEEIPHSVAVKIDDIEEKEKVYVIYASIFVERESQRGIIIGKEGRMIKRIGTAAREDIEYLLKKKVFLDLRVKVKEKWREKGDFIRSIVEVE